MVHMKALVATASAAALLLATPLSAIAVHPRQYKVDDWVTVDRNGNAQTITASVTTDKGSIRTISPAPYSLTGSVFTVTRTDGVLSTSTGLPPPPQATASGEGVFARCHGKIGPDEPFCQPMRGSSLYSGNTYFVTWDPDYFGLDNIFVQVSGWSVSSTTGEKLMGVADFFGARVPASKGFYAWSVEDYYLKGRVYNNMSLHLTFYDPRESKNNDIVGPTISVHQRLPIVAPAASGPSPLVIALPVVLGLLAIGGCAAFLWYRHRRKHGRAPVTVVKRSSSGYGARKSHSERVASQKTGHVDIQLNDSPTSPTAPSPAGGRNLFQEELRRQELERERA